MSLIKSGGFFSNCGYRPLAIDNSRQNNQSTISGIQCDDYIDHLVQEGIDKQLFPHNTPLYNCLIVDLETVLHIFSRNIISYILNVLTA